MICCDENLNQMMSQFTNDEIVKMFPNIRSTGYLKCDFEDGYYPAWVFFPEIMQNRENSVIFIREYSEEHLMEYGVIYYLPDISKSSFLMCGPERLSNLKVFL